jgi:hypothetical protein
MPTTNVIRKPDYVDINNKTEKTSLADHDVFLIEDSADNYKKKKVHKDNVSNPAAWGTITGTLANQTDLDNRFKAIEDDEVIIELFGKIDAGTTGTITKPTSTTILLDRYKDYGDALVTECDSAGRATDNPVFTAGGAVVSTTFDVSGNWAFSGTPAAYPITIIYCVKVKLKNIDSIPQESIFTYPEDTGIVDADNIIQDTTHRFVTDTQIGAFHSNSSDHTQGTDTALGTLGTKNPPVDADLIVQRNSESSFALITSTWTQIKAFLKTYFDTIYSAAGAIMPSLLTERGSIIYRNATIPAELLHGTVGDILQSGGHNADPSWLTILPITNGGTGQITAQAAINALTAVSGATNEHVLTKDTVTGNAIFKVSSGGGFANPMDALGNIIYGGAAGVATKLVGNITTAKMFLSQTGDGAASAEPVWAALVNADIPAALTSKTYDKITLTQPTSGATITITNGKTFSCLKTITLTAEADSMTLNIGSNSLTFSTSNTTTITLPTSGTMATLIGTETLSNKTLTAPKVTILKADSDGTSAIQLTKADGITNVLNIDTTYKQIGIDLATTPGYGIDITTQAATVGAVRATIYDDALACPTWISRQSRGTFANPVNSRADDAFGFFSFQGRKTGAFTYGAALLAYADSGPANYIPTRLVFKVSSATVSLQEAMRITSGALIGIGTTAPLRKVDINEASGNCLRLIYNDNDGSATNYTDFLISSGGGLTITPSAAVMNVTGSIYPATDNTYYLGKNSISTPLAWMGVCMKDTTNGNYYRLEIINGVVTATQIT